MIKTISPFPITCSHKKQGEDLMKVGGIKFRTNKRKYFMQQNQPYELTIMGGYTLWLLVKHRLDNV